MRLFVYAAVITASSAVSASAFCRPYEVAYPNHDIVYERAKELPDLFAMPQSDKIGVSDGAMFEDQRGDGVPDLLDPLALTVYGFRQAAFADYTNATISSEEASSQLAAANLCGGEKIAELNRLLRKYIAEQSIDDDFSPIKRAHQMVPFTDVRDLMGIQWNDFDSAVCFLANTGPNFDVPVYKLGGCF